MSPEEKRCLEGVVYPLMYIFVFLLSMPVLVKFMDSGWSKWLYCGLAFGGLFLMIRLRLLLNRVR